MRRQAVSYLNMKIQSFGNILRASALLLLQADSIIILLQSGMSPKLSCPDRGPSFGTLRGQHFIFIEDFGPP